MLPLRVAGWGALAVFLSLGWRLSLDAAIPGSAGDQTGGGPGLWSADLFAPGASIPVIRIRIDQTNQIKLIKDPRSYAVATVEEAGRVYTEVAIRLKGQEGGSYRPLYEKPAFTVNFDRNKEGQLFHGLDKIYLNNSVEDPSYMTEAICGELFRAAGVPNPRVMYSVVELGGRNRGLYVIKEGFNKRFLRRQFRNPDGNFYDGGLVNDITEPLERSSGEGPDDHADLQALARAAQERDPETRWRRLQEVLDMDRFISFLALEVIMGHSDGYALNRNNYRVYHDPRTQKLVFLPHGLDLMFSEPEGPSEPYMDGLVARAIMETAPGRERYARRLAELTTRVFVLETITNRIEQLRARIRPLLEKNDPKLAQVHDEAVKKLLRAVTQRARFLASAIHAPAAKPLDFTGAKPVIISGWRSRDETETARFSGERSREAVTTLRIRVRGDPYAMPSWRAVVLLRPGRYRFQGRVRTDGVMAREMVLGRGAGLRVAGGPQPRSNHVEGNSAWTEVAYGFEVAAGVEAEEIELICELLALQGEAQFDQESLQLVRVER